MKIRIDGTHYREAINLVNAISHLNPISVEIEEDGNEPVIIEVRFNIEGTIKAYRTYTTPALFVLYHENIADDICVVYRRMSEDANKLVYTGSI